MRYLLFIYLVLCGFYSNAATLAENNCEKLKVALAAAGLPLQAIQVPLNYSKPEGAKLKMAYWVRPGKKSRFPPLLLIHGGPGSGSSRFLDWKPIMQNYPGDVLAVDVRGDGCSSPLPSNLMPEDFADFRARNIVLDLEQLRATLYGEKTSWRIFGQSRGSVVGHYYLDMFPQSIESLHLHGFSMGSRESMLKYSHTRSFFSARSSYKFVELYPKAELALDKLRNWLDIQRPCFDFEVNEDANLHHRVCGRAALDVLSFELTSQTNWPKFAEKLESLLSSGHAADFGLHTKAAFDYLQSKFTTNTYAVILNYIAGTNAVDMGHPNPEVLKEIVNDSYIQDAPICEGRFILNAILPWYQAQYGKMFLAGADPINHARILKFMVDYEHTRKTKFKYFLYTSENDPVAGPEAYNDEREFFGSYVNCQVLLDSAHDGWLTDPLVTSNLLKPPQKAGRRHATSP